MTPAGIFYLALIIGGGVGALGFVVDYIRTADLRQPVSRMLLTLNFAMGTILILSFLRHFAGLPRTWVITVTMFLFLVVDASVFYQWYLMRTSRKRHTLLKQGEEKDGSTV